MERTVTIPLDEYLNLKSANDTLQKVLSNQSGWVSLVHYYMGSMYSRSEYVYLQEHEIIDKLNKKYEDCLKELNDEREFRRKTIDEKYKVKWWKF